MSTRSWQSLSETLAQLEKEDPDVARAAANYRSAVDRIVHGPRLSPDEVARLYDLSQPVPPEWEIHSEASPACGPEGESPGQR